ncbi:MAG TPA: alpha/beta fold hydrolase [Thermoleophilaceae bacterium]|nr:alpha/beta fold hydrolase [Thermoleophilaceae bacterium]
MNAGANAWDLYLGDGVAHIHPTPKAIVDEGPQRTVYRYLSNGRQPSHATPLLLVPPLAAPAWCFDLRQGCSLAEHLLRRGYPTYVVDYGAISFSDRALGLEHWVDDVIPNAIEAVARDSGRSEIQLVGWCLGGIMALLATAARDLPVRSVALMASPFDFARVRMMAPIRRLASLTGGALGTTLYRMLGGAPAPLVSLGFRATAIDRYITKPIALAQHLHDREWIAHAQAVDEYMASMLAYPGRTFGQLYHQFFRVNELAGGTLELGDHRIELSKIDVPVLAVGGKSDVLAPVAAVHHVGSLLPNSPDVRLETAPGGHLGVLTGRRAVRSTWIFVDEFLADYDAGRRGRARESRPGQPRRARPVSARRSGPRPSAGTAASRPRRSGRG